MGSCFFMMRKNEVKNSTVIACTTLTHTEWMTDVSTLRRDGNLGVRMGDWWDFPPLERLGRGMLKQSNKCLKNCKNHCFFILPP